MLSRARVSLKMALAYTKNSAVMMDPRRAEPSFFFKYSKASDWHSAPSAVYDQLALGHSNVPQLSFLTEHEPLNDFKGHRVPFLQLCQA